MQSLKSVNIGGRHCDIVISDENVALWEAFNSHRATVAILGKEYIDIAVSKYAVYDFFDIDEKYLEKVACRYLHIPVCIGKSDNIKIRELCTDDFYSLSKFREFPFKNIKELQEYIDFHYDFYGYGLYVFDIEKTEGVKDVYTRIDISNTASIKLADKLGVNIVN